MTDNPNRIPFNGMPREDQDRIAGAFLRGERVEKYWSEKWSETDLHGFFPEDVYRIPPTTKPAKDPNRPRPAHKLNLHEYDVVRHVGWQDDVGAICGLVTVGSQDENGDGDWLQAHIYNPSPKGHRPLFVVVSRANGSS